MPLTIIDFLHGRGVGRSRGDLARRKHFAGLRRHEMGCRPNVRQVSRVTPICIPHIRQKGGILLGLDSKTAWRRWKHFQLHGLWDAPTGRPSILIDEQLNQVIEFAMEHFYCM
jgi:hypothetical protein